jgi:hypothetical protein
MFTLIGGRRHPYFVSSQNGVITDVVNDKIVQVYNPAQGTFVAVPRQGGSFLEVFGRPGLPGPEVVEVNRPCFDTEVITPVKRGPLPGLPRQETVIVDQNQPIPACKFMPYAITLSEYGAPTVIAIKNAPRNSLKIKPRTELIVD